MDLAKLMQWLQWQMMPEEQKQMLMQKRAQELNALVPREGGNIKQQGLGGIFSDSLPFTPKDQFKYKHPGLADILDRFPEETPPMQQRHYKGYL